MAKTRHGFAAEPTWYIYRLRHTPATFVGSVEAPDAETAIKKRSKNSTSPTRQQQARLIAQRRS